MKKLPLINSDNKKVRILGYVVYAWVLLSILGSLVPAENSIEESTAEAELKTVDEWYTAARNIVVPENEDEARKKIDYYQHVLELDPNNRSALLDIAWTYSSALHDGVNAVNYANKALKLQPRNVDLLEKKAFYLEVSGKIEESMSVLDEMISIANDGKPYYETDYGNEEVEGCRKPYWLYSTWMTKGSLALKLRPPLVEEAKEYSDNAQKYMDEYRRCEDLA
jgi:tetratricopeptide (TPR) repeat protein